MTEDELWLLSGLVIGFFALLYKGIYLPNQLYFDSGEWIKNSIAVNCEVIKI